MTLTVKRATTRVPLCLDGDLKAAHEAAEAEYNAANARRLADPRFADSTRKLAQAVLDIEEQMKDQTVEFLLRGMQRGKWADLTTENEPREGNTLDSSYGFNVEAVMIVAIPACIESVKNRKGEALPFDPTKDWDPLVTDMTNSQYEDFVLGALRVNAGRNDVPFSLSAFRATQDSEAK
jgi:hypothetical protein